MGNKAMPVHVLLVPQCRDGCGPAQSACVPATVCYERVVVFERHLERRLSGRRERRLSLGISVPVPAVAPMCGERTASRAEPIKIPALYRLARLAVKATQQRRAR
jgi:hypothetical protein